MTLLVTAGPIRGQRYEYSAHDTFPFGRSPDCHAQLAATDASASRHHFLLEGNPPAARLRDLGSLNGTHVNGVRHGGRGADETPEEGAQREYPQVDLKDGDQIRVGATVFRVSVDCPAVCCDCSRAIGEGVSPETEGLLDVHLVTDDDIARGESFASKIGAVTDAARPLAMGRTSGE